MLSRHDFIDQSPACHYIARNNTREGARAIYRKFMQFLRFRTTHIESYSAAAVATINVIPDARKQIPPVCDIARDTRTMISPHKEDLSSRFSFSAEDNEKRRNEQAWKLKCLPDTQIYLFSSIRSGLIFDQRTNNTDAPCDKYKWYYMKW